MSPAGNIAGQKPQSAGSGEIIAADLACVQCGYNLRSLRMEGSCPECGRPVAESHFGLFLSQAAVWWLESMIRGAWLLSAYLVLQPLAAGAVIASSLIFIGFPWLIAIVYVMGSGGCVTLLTLALWSLTTRDPENHVAPPGRWRELLLRAAMLIYAVVYILIVLRQVMTRPGGLSLFVLADWDHGDGVGEIMLLLLRIGLVMFLAIHLCLLIRPWRDPSLNPLVHMLIKGVACVLVLAVLEGLIIVFFAQDLAPWGGITVFLNYSVFLVFMGWWIMLLILAIKLWLRLSHIHSLRMR